MTSRDTAAEKRAVDTAAATLGVSDTEVRWFGSWALAWVLALTGTKHITPLADTRPRSVQTAWGPDDYAAMARIAKSKGASVAELQKTSAIFVAYVLQLAAR